MRRSLRSLSVVAIVAASSALVLGAPMGVSAATPPHPVVLSARATPSGLGPDGGQVEGTGTVKAARSCQLQLLSRQSFPVVYSHDATTACGTGTYSAYVTIGANPTPVRRTVAFALVARNGPFSFTGRFDV